MGRRPRLRITPFRLLVWRRYGAFSSRLLWERRRFLGRVVGYPPAVMRDRLQLALERLDAGKWEAFEELASGFAASQYPNLQTLASASGDRGRDAVLWQPENDPTVVLQYSVTRDWDAKIRTTAARLAGEFADVQVLMFFSPQSIGPNADAVVEAVRKKHGLFVQIRDRSWFLDRVHSSTAAEKAAERLATMIVDPLVAPTRAGAPPSVALDDEDAAAAVLYLALQLEDDSLEKGLTKTCFDGLVRAVLRGTDPQNRLARTEIHRRVLEVVPSASPQEVATKVDSALARLEKRFIRHHSPEDEFCLSYSERERLREKIVSFELVESDLRATLRDRLLSTCSDLKLPGPGDVDGLVDRARKVLEIALLERGETFVRALANGDPGIYTLDEIVDAVVRDFGTTGGDKSGFGGAAVPLISAAVHQTLTHPTPQTLSYLQLFARSYTLFSLARATPNVQKVIVKMFSGGELWMDTTAVLPLFAETLVEEEERRFTELIQAAKGAGVRLFVTPGVVEEIERHMNRSRAFMSSNNWKGAVPFLAAAYEFSGEESGQIERWLETFRGRSRPEADIAEYLDDEFGIALKSLSEEASAVSEELRYAVREVWSEIHDKRRARSAAGLDPITALKLADHDSENYLGVLYKRRNETQSSFGYSTWWLTLDRSAFTVRNRLRDRLSGATPASPVLSPDFLSHYLSIGPIRQYLKQGSEKALPLMVDVGAMDLVSTELMEVAARVREECGGLPRRVMRRRIRDALDAQRLKEGPMARDGLGVVEDWLASV